MLNQRNLEPSMKQFITKLLENDVLNRKFTDKSESTPIIELRTFCSTLTNDFNLVNLVNLTRIFNRHSKSNNPLISQIFAELKIYLMKEYEKLGIERWIGFDSIFSALNHEIFNDDNNIEMLCFQKARYRFVRNIYALTKFQDKNAINLKNFVLLLSLPDSPDEFYVLIGTILTLFSYIELDLNTVITIHEALKNNKTPRYAYQRYLNEKFKLLTQDPSLYHVLPHHFKVLHDKGILTPEVIIYLYKDYKTIYPVHEKLDTLLGIEFKYLRQNNYICELLEENCELQQLKTHVNILLSLEKKGISYDLLNDTNGVMAKLLFFLDESGFNINEPKLLEIITNHYTYIESLFISITLIKYNLDIQLTLRLIKTADLKTYIEDLIFKKLPYIHNICFALCNEIKYFQNYIPIARMDEILNYPQQALSRSVIANSRNLLSNGFSYGMATGGTFIPLSSSRPRSIVSDYYSIIGKTQLLFFATKSKDSPFSIFPKECLAKIASYTSKLIDSQSSEVLALTTFSASENHYKEAEWELELEQCIFNPNFEKLLRYSLSNPHEIISINNVVTGLAAYMNSLLNFILDHANERFIFLRYGYKEKLEDLLENTLGNPTEIILSEDQITSLEELVRKLMKVTTHIMPGTEQTKAIMNCDVKVKYVMSDYLLTIKTLCPNPSQESVNQLIADLYLKYITMNHTMEDGGYTQKTLLVLLGTAHLEDKREKLDTLNRAYDLTKGQFHSVVDPKKEFICSEVKSNESIMALVTEKMAIETSRQAPPPKENCLIM